MKTNFPEHPRRFKVGKSGDIEMSDLGKIELEPNEMISFITKSGKEYDVTAKDWGFYATPSLNGRLKDQGFKSALVKNLQGRYYIMLVEKESLKLFEKYLDDENQELIEWLDER